MVGFVFPLAAQTLALIFHLTACPGAGESTAGGQNFFRGAGGGSTDIGRPAAAHLIEALGHEHILVSRKAPEILQKIGELATHAIISAVRDKSKKAQVRSMAASVLGNIGSALAVDAIASALADEDSGVRISAASRTRGKRLEWHENNRR